jgi:hypothetical protein
VNSTCTPPKNCEHINLFLISERIVSSFTGVNYVAVFNYSLVSL